MILCLFGRGASIRLFFLFTNIFEKICKIHKALIRFTALPVGFGFNNLFGGVLYTIFLLGLLDDHGLVVFVIILNEIRHMLLIGIMLEVF